MQYLAAHIGITYRHHLTGVHIGDLHDKSPIAHLLVWLADVFQPRIILFEVFDNKIHIQREVAMKHNGLGIK